MAMLISKFHRLIQSRLLWLFFLVVIVFSFVIWGMQSPGRSRAARRAEAAGLLEGRIVPQDEYRRAYAHTYLSLALLFGGRVDGIPAQAVREEAWKRAASLQQADALGLTAGDEEVAQAIRSYPLFVAQGQFDSARYTSFTQGFLRELGFTEQQFEQFMREELIIGKARQALGQFVLLSPHEMNRALASVGDTFDLNVFRISRGRVGEKEPSETEVRALFERAPAAFMIPPRVEAVYVRFPLERYLGDVSVSEEEALDFYDLHLERYVRDPEDSEAPDGAGEPSNTSLFGQVPFENVRDEIMAELIREKAHRTAMDAATDFSVALAPDRQGRAPSLEELAGRQEREILSLPPFQIDQPLPEIDAGLAFNQAAFDLRPGPDDYFSDAVPGRDHAYVVILRNRLPAREPAFEEVEERVREAARRQAREQAFHTLVNEAREALEQGLAAGRSPADIAEDLEVEFFALTGLNATTIEDGDEDSRDLLRAAVTHLPGEVADPVPVEEGALLLHIAERQPVDPEFANFLRPQVLATLKRERARLLFEDWRDGLLRPDRFEDFSASYYESYEDDEDEEPWDE